MGLTQAALAEAMHVQRKHVNEFCNDRRRVTTATASILARVFGNTPDLRLNLQNRNDLWEAMPPPDGAKADRASYAVAASGVTMCQRLRTVIPVAPTGDWYARRVGVAAAREINTIPAGDRLSESQGLGLLV